MSLPKIEIKNILYPTDFSAHADYSLAHAVSLAGLYGAEIILLNVLPENPAFLDSNIASYFKDDQWKTIKNRQKEDAREKLAELRKKYLPAKKGLDDIVVSRGAAVEQILETAEKRECGLIVMGAHGEGGIAGAMIGGTARRVLRRSKLPVLVVRLPGEDQLSFPHKVASYSHISAIIPTLNEEAALPQTLGRLSSFGFELIAADGGSTDATEKIARSFGARVVASRKGRARQMNRGAEAASGEILFFIHADSIPPLSAPYWIENYCRRKTVAAGAFRLSFDTKQPILRCVAALANIRASWASLPYGDQGLFLNRKIFEQVGGFPDIPIMEDIEMIQRLKKIVRIHLAPACMVTSARRWRAGGSLRHTLANQLRLIRYYSGTPPSTLARSYGHIRDKKQD